MSARASVAEFTRVSELLPKQTFDVPEAESRALSTEVQTQLASLPTTIPDIDTYRKVVESLPLLKRAEDKVVAFFKDIKDAAFKAHRAITAKESEQLKPISEARARLSRLKYAFEQEQDRLKREQERIAAVALRTQHTVDALDEAQALFAAGEVEMADQVVEQAIAAPPLVVVLPDATAAVVSDVKGVGKSKPRWVWRYMGAPDHETAWKDLAPAQRERIMALMPRNYLAPAESAITKMVSASDGNIRIPGIEIFDIGSTPVRG